jgi:hypothetical protein
VGRPNDVVYPASRPAGCLAGLLSAVGAEAEHVESVAVRLEPFGFGELVDGFGYGSFEGGGGGDVDDFAAVGAEEVVVVFGEVLGQLEPGELVMGGDAPNDSGDAKVDEVAVRRASRRVGEPAGDVADADGLARRDEEVDDGPAGRWCSAYAKGSGVGAARSDKNPGRRLC